MSILIVEDSVPLRALLRHQLEGMGYVGREIAEAADGVEAMKYLEGHDHEVQAVLLDWIMPNLDGFEVLKRVKQSPRLKHIPIIMVTCQSQTDNVVQAMRAGAHDYLVKPIRPEELARKITDLGESAQPAAGRPVLQVLVVDDSDTQRKVAISALTDLKGFKVQIHEASEGQAALDFLIGGEPKIDVVVSDWEMPGLDGIELLRQLRCHEGLDQIPFIMLTSTTRRERVVEAMKEGAFGYMVKPIRPEALREKVREALGERQPDPRRNETMVIRRALAQVIRPGDANAPFLDQLPGEIRAALEARAVKRSIPAGQILVRFNDVVTWFHLIAQGEVEILSGLDEETGEGQGVEIRRAGDPFGEGSFLTGDSAALIARTRTPVQTMSVEARPFEEVLHKYPQFGIYLSRLMSRQSDRDSSGLWSKVGGGLSGQVGQMPPVEVVQSLNQSRKSGVLHFSRPDAHGEIYFHDGEVRRARVGTQTGEDAFFELMAWQAGSFTFKAGEREVQPEDLRPTMGLLMEALRLQDERKQ